MSRSFSSSEGEVGDNLQMAKLRRTYKHRIYPTRRQTLALDGQLAFACDLYNAALEQRKEWWRRGRRISGYDQSRQFTELRREMNVPDAGSWSLRYPLKQLDFAFAAFFRRVKAGEKPGYPRFRSKARFNSLTASFSNGGCRLVDGRLYLQGVGHLKVKWHREIPSGADLRTVTIRRQNGKWYTLFSLVLDGPRWVPEPSDKEVGLDLGIGTFAARSDGQVVEGPRALRAARRQLRRQQRRVARRVRGSNGQRQARRQVAKTYERIGAIRRDHAHKQSRALVEEFGTVYIENLNVKGLARGMLAREVNDQGWGQFVEILSSKAEEAGRRVVKVDPRGTSQMCSGCGQVVPKGLAVRVHRCDCGLVLDRDVNAARNILGLGQGLQALTDGEEASVV